MVVSPHPLLTTSSTLISPYLPMLTSYICPSTELPLGRSLWVLALTVLRTLCRMLCLRDDTSSVGLSNSLASSFREPSQNGCVTSPCQPSLKIEQMFGLQTETANNGSISFGFKCHKLSQPSCPKRATMSRQSRSNEITLSSCTCSYNEK